MNLGDGLLFELENGKPKLILLSHGVDKNPQKQLSFRPRVANILSSRQPSCVEEVQEERPAPQQAGRRRETKSRAEGVNTPFTSNTVTSVGKSTTLTLSKTHDYNKGGNIKTVATVKSERQRHSTNVGALRASEKTGQPQRRVTPGSGKDLLASGDSMVCLTNTQLQQILNTVQNLNNGKHTLEDHKTQDVGDYGNQTNSKSGTFMNGSGGMVKQEDSGGGKEIKHKGGGEESDTTRSPPDKDNRSSGGLFSWLEERQSDSRATLDARKAQWRRELDEQVALKQQQRSDPGRLQAEEDRESVLSVRSSISHREQPAGIKSSLKLGEVTPMEEALSVERRKEQSRRWLEELDRQREETNERRRREKLLQSQTEDHELWATHFDSLQKKPPVQTAAPAPSSGSERREREPLSRLSLVGEATSSIGPERICAANVATTNSIHKSKPSYLRTMTALLDPAQIEERERRRLKQLEQQRAIEAQVEERRRQREQEEARRREEEEEEERRVKQEMDILQRKYELASKRERQKEQLNLQEDKTDAGHKAERLQETLEPSITRKDESVEEVLSSLVPPYKDTAVQTEVTCSLPLGAEKVQSSPPLSAAAAAAAAPPNSRSRALRTGKENVCLPVGRDPYEAFARTERNQKDKKRPEWNTQRPSCQFVPASERYPAALQRNRQESRLKRQAKLLALQERACLSRTDPPPQSQEPRLYSDPAQTRTSPNRKGESVSGAQNISATINIKRGRSPPIPALRLKVQSQHASTPSPPVLEFIPYVRTEEAFNLDPLEPADTPPDPHTGPPQSSASLPASSHRDPLLHPELLCNTPTHRQQEILRGLAQLRQGLLQTQRELETDLNPLLKRHDDEFPLPSAAHHM